MIVYPCGLFDALAALFEALWGRAQPAGSVPGKGGSDDQRDQLIALLLSGATDRTIVRRLGIGYRTAQCQIADVLRDLGATTRFQVGAQAAFRPPTNWGKGFRG